MSPAETGFAVAPVVGIGQNVAMRALGIADPATACVGIGKLVEDRRRVAFFVEGFPSPASVTATNGPPLRATVVASAELLEEPVGPQVL
jgi:hypothetical protein